MQDSNNNKIFSYSDYTLNYNIKRKKQEKEEFIKSNRCKTEN